MSSAPALHPAVALADEYLLPTYKRPNVVFTHGEGCRAFASDGRRYLDFLGGIAVNALGHSHPRIVRVLRRQAARAIHFSNLYHNEFQAPLAQKLCEWSGMDRAFFSNSGTEAVEGALKLARLFARKRREEAARGPGGDGAPAWRFLALENSFHGRTLGALAVTHAAKYREPFEPLVPGAAFVPFDDAARLEAEFDDSVCAVILETIQGEGGIRPVSGTFWECARRLTAGSGAVLIADEIQCGLCRTGRKFAYQKFPAPPDIVVVAKPLAAGLPLGSILTTEKIAAAISPGLHGTTFGGGPLACAVALEALAVMEEENLAENARERGAELRAGLERIAGRFDFVREVRGEGLMLGVELSVPGAAYVQAAFERGVLMNCAHDFTLRLLPPLIVTSAEVREFLGVLERIFEETPRPAAAPAAATAAASR
jgi:acetylornithine aminotransferase/acetylornithine/N-succinyldiaminopimelate aminotransferase